MADSLADAQRALNAKLDRDRRAKMGEPLDLGDAALDALAAVGDQDFAAAKALWRTANSGPIRDLLDAAPREE